MLYAATGFWLMVIVLCAWGVHEIWSSLVKPKVVNAVLLPGTLAAQLGHVLGLLVTGGTVHNTTLFKDDETGGPQQTPDPKPRIPIIGPVVVGVLPLVLCAGGIFLAARIIGGPTVNALTAGSVNNDLPLSLAAFWDLLREQITLMEETLTIVVQSNLTDWHSWLFLYLLICLTVRMAPFPGNLRGSLGAILLVALLAALAGSFIPQTQTFIESGWSVMSLSVAALMLLLLVSLVVRGTVSLVRLLATER